nr:hypothetical protein [Mesorhizobium sp.]
MSAVKAVGLSEHWFRHRGTMDGLDAPGPRACAASPIEPRAEEDGNGNPLGAGGRLHDAMHGGTQGIHSMRFEQSPMLTAIVPGIVHIHPASVVSDLQPFVVVLQQQGLEATILVRVERCRTERTRS